MKCQMCGRNEVNFHHSSNINGCVTETNLCSQCAADSGYGFEQFSFGDLFPVRSGLASLMPVMMPALGFDVPVRLALKPRVARPAQPQACSCCGDAQKADTAEVDGEMKKRRELYNEMRLAAENEDFEKAAKLRDEIKQMEV